MHRNKLIVAGVGIILMVLAVIILIRELHLWPASVGIIIAADGTADTETTVQQGQKEDLTADIIPDSSQDTMPDNSDTKDTSDTQDNSATQNTSDNTATQAADADAQVTVSQGGSQMFYFTELSQEIKDRITGVSYPEGCEVPYEELRYVSVLYWGFDDRTHTGELIVNQFIAQDIVDIFKELYDLRYPIEQMVLVDDYKADDNASMAADNTSSFNYRPIPDGSGRLSLHSYGLAIDVNPLYNPYIRDIDGVTVVSPDNGATYADRSLDLEYYIRKDDICYKAFTSRGFTWGGDWKNQKDYQHFQKKKD